MDANSMNKGMATITLKLFTALLLVLAAGLVVYGAALAQESEAFPTDNDVNAIAKQLYCPVCPNTPLDVCETKACEDWRAQIKEQLAAGWSEQRIMDYFVEQHGERVLAEPKRAGFNSLVWMLPVVAVIFGTAFVWQVLKGWRRNQAHAVPAAAPRVEIPADVLAKLEKELKEID